MTGGGAGMLPDANCSGDGEDPRSRIHRASARERRKRKEGTIVGLANLLRLNEERPNKMTSETMFWWNWWVSAVAAFATFLAIVVALFSQWILNKLFPPRLTLELLDPGGSKTHLGDENRRNDARYYHLQVSNGSRRSLVNDVQVSLMRMDVSGPNGEIQQSWLGPVPMRWAYQDVSPLTRTIGPGAYCDLCRVVKGDGKNTLELLPLVHPNSLGDKWHENIQIVLSLQARGNEADSPILRVKISWDGDWGDGVEEMKGHLSLKVLTDQEA